MITVSNQVCFVRMIGRRVQEGIQPVPKCLGIVDRLFQNLPVQDPSGYLKKHNPIHYRALGLLEN